MNFEENMDQNNNDEEYFEQEDPDESTQSYGIVSLLLLLSPAYLR